MTVLYVVVPMGMHCRQFSTGSFWHSRSVEVTLVVKVIGPAIFRS